MFCPATSQQKSTLLFASFCELSNQRPQSSSAPRFTAGAITPAAWRYKSIERIAAGSRTVACHCSNLLVQESMTLVVNPSFRILTPSSLSPQRALRARSRLSRSSTGPFRLEIKSCASLSSFAARHDAGHRPLRPPPPSSSLAFRTHLAVCSHRTGGQTYGSAAASAGWCANTG
jgi:hypothetical protein